MTSSSIVWVAHALALILASTACERGLTEVNANPNQPEVVPVENVLLSGIWDVLSSGGSRGSHGHWTQMHHAENWVQHVAQPIFNEEDKYTPRTGIPTAIWDEMYFALADLDYVKEIATQSGSDNLWAVAEIMTAYGFMVLTDYFGDIPYEDALGLADGAAFPRYTPQAEIYPDLIARLAAASARIESAGSVSFGAFDPVYHGGMAGWERFGNSLRLRLAMRMSGTDQSDQAAQAFRAAWEADVFGGVDDRSDIEWLGIPPAQNPLYEEIVLGGRSGDFRLSESLVDRMLALDDPRLPVYAEPAADGEFRGLRNGLEPSSYQFEGRTGGSADFSTIGAYFLDRTTPSVLMSYAELLFLGAEAAERGWIAADPGSLYEAGVGASMEQFGVSQAAADAYLARPDVAYGGLEDVWLQKWFALYLGGPEAFAEMRRVGWMDLEPAENSTLGDEFPARLYYPPGEALYNPEHYPGDVPLTSPLWWMR